MNKNTCLDIIQQNEFLSPMTATEFELMVAEYLSNLGKGLSNFRIKHDTRLSAHDGIYQIDVLASYTALNVSMMVLVECKRYAKPVARHTVQVLHDKLHSTGAHKGVIFSTSGYQDGAIAYALRHKIALVTFLQGKFLTVTNSFRPKPGHLPARSYIAQYYADGSQLFITPGNLFSLIGYLQDFFET